MKRAMSENHIQRGNYDGALERSENPRGKFHLVIKNKL